LKGIDVGVFFGIPETYFAEKGGEVAFLAGDIDKPAGGEGCGVQGAETRCGDDEGKEEGTDWAENFGSELNGNGVGAVDGLEWEDKEVGYVCEEVGEDYEGHCGVDYAGKIARGVPKFAHYVVGLQGC